MKSDFLSDHFSEFTRTTVSYSKFVLLDTIQFIATVSYAKTKVSYNYVFGLLYFHSKQDIHSLTQVLLQRAQLLKEFN